MVYKMPTFTFTHAAMVAAAAKGEGETELTRAAQAGVMDLMGGKSPEEHNEEDDGGPDDPMDVFFHTFGYHGDYNMIMTPMKDGTMSVDVAEVEESEGPTSGPFAGKKIRMPKRFSD